MLSDNKCRSAVIADDDEILLAMAEYNMQSLGVAVTAVNNWRDGLRSLLQDCPDIFVTDNDNPESDAGLSMLASFLSEERFTDLLMHCDMKDRTWEQCRQAFDRLQVLVLKSASIRDSMRRVLNALHEEWGVEVHLVPGAKLIEFLRARIKGEDTTALEHDLRKEVK